MTSIRGGLAWALGSVLALGSAIVGGLGLDPLFAFLGATAEVWSSILIMGGRFVLPEFFGEELGQTILVFGVLAYLGFKSVELAEHAVAWLRNDKE